MILVTGATKSVGIVFAKRLAFDHAFSALAAVVSENRRRLAAFQNVVASAVTCLKHPAVVIRLAWRVTLETVNDSAAQANRSCNRPSGSPVLSADWAVKIRGWGGKKI